MNRLRLKYKWRLFLNHKKNYGLWQALKYIFGGYWLLPADKEPAPSEALARAILREARLLPSLWKPVIQNDTMCLVPTYDKDTDEWPPDVNAYSCNLDKTLAYWVAMYGVNGFGTSLDYERDEDGQEEAS